MSMTSMDNSNPELRAKDAVKAAYGNTSTLDTRLVANNFLNGSVYYAEFQVDPPDPKADTFCYVLVNAAGARIFDDGVAIIRELQTDLDRRRSFFQRLGDFTINDLIGAIIALVVTAGFAAILYQGTLETNAQLLAVFTLILGYYFGKTVKT